MSNDASLSAPQSPQTPAVLVWGAPSQIGWYNRLIDSVPDQASSIAFESIEPEELSLESQQQDAAQAAAAEEKLRTEILNALRNEKKTGPVQVFLLDSAQVAAGDVTSQATLRALVKASLSDASNVVAALMPQDTNGDNLEQTSKLPEATQNVVNAFLANLSVPSVESHEDLIALLATRT